MKRDYPRITRIFANPNPGTATRHPHSYFIRAHSRGLVDFPHCDGPVRGVERIL